MAAEEGLHSDIDAGTAATQAAVSVAAVAIGASDMQTALAGAGLTGVAFIAKFWSGHAKRRAERWWTDFVREVSRLSDEAAVLEATTGLGDPAREARMYEATNAVLNAIDEELLPHIAFVAAEYHARARPVDSFYKHYVRFLQDLNGPELELLRTVLAEAHVALQGGDKAIFFFSEGVLKVRPVADDAERKRVAVNTSRASVVLRRLVNHYLVDEADVYGQGISVSINSRQWEQLSRYVSRGFAL